MATKTRKAQAKTTVAPQKVAPIVNKSDKITMVLERRWGINHFAGERAGFSPSEAKEILEQKSGYIAPNPTAEEIEQAIATTPKDVCLVRFLKEYKAKFKPGSEALLKGGVARFLQAVGWCEIIHDNLEAEVMKAWDDEE